MNMSFHQSIPREVMTTMLDSGDRFAEQIRYAIWQFESSTRSQTLEGRFDGWGRNRIWFGSAQTSLDMLDLLWSSTSNEPAQRYTLITILRYAINTLPHWKLTWNADEDADHGLMWVAPIFIVFVRKNRIVELVNALRAKSLSSCGWLNSRNLRSELLAAMQAMDYSLDVNEFLGQIIDQPKKQTQDARQVWREMLDYGQFKAFCLAYVAGLIHVNFEDQNTRKSAVRRLTALTLSANVIGGRPERIVSEFPGLDQDFDAEFQDETELGVFEGEVKRCLKTLLSDLRGTEQTDQVLSDSDKMFEELMRHLAASSSTND